MNRFAKGLMKAGFLFAALLFAWQGAGGNAFAQSAEEMQVLRLFYREDQLVSSATRNPKPLSRTAENMSVVTAREIEAMNAHTVAEVLNRVPGLFVNFNQDFGAISLLGIEGAEQRHTLVLLDGVPWNFLSEGSAETNRIPLGIIERIEIIKGPASSAWGSSLGGVVNILTKEAGRTERPSGKIRTSFGERNTRDLSTQAAGMAGPLGYYLFAGQQASDGLKADRAFSGESLFSRFRLPLGGETELGFTAGVSRSENTFGVMPETDITATSDARSLFLRGTLDARLTPELALNLSVHRVEQKSRLKYDTLGRGDYLETAPGLFQENTFDEQRTGGGGKLVWTKGIHALVFGIEGESGRLAQTIAAGDFLKMIGLPPTSLAEPTLTRWDVYANDTVTLGDWSITPGLRYDYNSIAGSFLSPSLGLTRPLGKKSLARAFMARGFTQPPLSWTSAGALFLSPNASLGHEKVWSLQAGLETSLPYLWLKGGLFHQELEDAFVRVATAPMDSQYINRGTIRRQGLEIEAETIAFHNFYLAAGLAYVRIDASEEEKRWDRYAGNVALRYDGRAFQGRLLGHYIWWDFDGTSHADYGAFIWDLNLSRRLFDRGPSNANLFLTVRNLFNGNQYSQYDFVDDRNPGRWFEAGLDINF